MTLMVVLSRWPRKLRRWVSSRASYCIRVRLTMARKNGLRKLRRSIKECWGTLAWRLPMYLSLWVRRSMPIWVAVAHGTTMWWLKFPKWSLRVTLCQLKAFLAMVPIPGTFRLRVIAPSASAMQKRFWMWWIILKITPNIGLLANASQVVCLPWLRKTLLSSTKLKERPSIVNPVSS